jgi:TonB family protein
MDADQHMGALYPFSLNDKLKVITETSPWYSDASGSPWGRPIIPFEMISVLAEYSSGTARFPVKGPAVGLFADQEIRLIKGPLFVGEDYIIRREIAALPPPDPLRETGNPQERELDERRRQLLRLLAEIEKRINEENARPKKRYISPATREEVYALYYDALRRRIEERGTRDFPEQGGRKLYGELTMNITVDAAGRVVEAEIVRPSKNRRLDQQAIAIVRAASPFGLFTPAMRAQADQIVVTSRFRFTREDGLETTLSGR